MLKFVHLVIGVLSHTPFLPSYKSVFKIYSSQQRERGEREREGEAEKEREIETNSSGTDRHLTLWGRAANRPSLVIKLGWTDWLPFLCFLSPRVVFFEKASVSLFLYWPLCETGRLNDGRWCVGRGNPLSRASLHSSRTEVGAGSSRMGSRQDLEQNESVLWGGWMSHAYTIPHGSESLIHESPWAEPHVGRRVHVLSRHWEERLSRGGICQLAHLVSQVNDCPLRVKKRKGSKRKRERDVEKSCASQIQFTYFKNFSFILSLWKHSKLLSKNLGGGKFPAVPWLGLHALTAKSQGLIPGQGTRLSQALWPKMFKNK